MVELTMDTDDVPATQPEGTELNPTTSAIMEPLEPVKEGVPADEGKAKRKSLTKALRASLRKGSSRKLSTASDKNSEAVVNSKKVENKPPTLTGSASSTRNLPTSGSTRNLPAAGSTRNLPSTGSRKFSSSTGGRRSVHSRSTRLLGEDGQPLERPHDECSVPPSNKGWFSSIWHQMTHTMGRPKVTRQSSVMSTATLQGNKFDVVLNIQGDLVPASSEALRSYPGSVFALMAEPPPTSEDATIDNQQDAESESGAASRRRSSSGKRHSMKSATQRPHSTHRKSKSESYDEVAVATSASGGLKRDSRGNVYISHASPQFHRLLDYVHMGFCEMPKLASDEWVQLRYDATNFKLEPLLQEMEQAESTLAEWARDRIRIAMLQMEFKQTKQDLEAKQRERKYMYNLLIAGVTGTGKSSSLNTILDCQACPVSGAQAQGTRGTTLRDGVIDDLHFMSYVDTQGLGADTSVSDEELMAQIMTSAESVRAMGVINNVLLSFDTAARTTPAHMANQLTLMELFNEVKRSCFLCLTKWNSNAVMAEWNLPLKKWVRKWRRARDIGDITQDPPSYDVMYEAYCKYLVKSMVNGQDGGAFAKIVTFLLFFEARVVWMFNLEQIQIEDMEDGVLEPHILFMYHFYRNKALDVLRLGSSEIQAKDIMFLKGTKDTMLGVAKSLVRMRNRKITQLELVGLQKDKRAALKAIFLEKLSLILDWMATNNYDSVDGFTDEIARLAGVERDGSYVGCAMQ